MDVGELLVALSAREIELFVTGDQLRYRAPAGALTAELKQAISTHRAALLAHLMRPRPQPLSSAQQRMWFLDRLVPDDASYNVANALDIAGELDRDALELAVQRMVERHPALRTKFVEDGDEPVQIVMPAESIAWERIDLTTVPEDARLVEATRLARERARRPFDLASGRLLRVSMLALAPARHVIVIVSHHIAVDGWSIGLLVREIAECYRARVERREPVLPPLPITYADYAVRERATLAATRDAELAHWRGVLDDAPTALHLPSDRPRSSERTGAGATIHRLVPAALAGELRELARREGVTLFTVMLAGVNALLQRWCREDDVVVATAVSTRTRPDVANIVGCFANVLLLRSDLGGSPSTRELLRRTRDVLSAAFQHQELPFDAIVRALWPGTDTATTPHYQVMFGFDNARDAFELPGLRVSSLEIDLGTTRSDLNVLAYERPDGLALSFEYSSELFDASTIERFAAQLLRLYAAMLAEPARPVCRLAVVTGDERRAAIEQWNATEAALPVAPVIDLFEQIVARTPDAPAVVSSAGTLGYRELDARANRLAHLLAARGVRRGDCVAFAIPRSLESAVAILAIWKAGACYLAIDPATPADRARDLAARAHARLVVTAAVLDELSDEPATRPPRATELDDLAYVVYTSGSTGTPKGVMISHRALANHARALVDRLVVAPADRVLQFASLAFDVSCEEMFPTWLAGATLVVCDDAARESFTAFTRFVVDQRLTVLNLPSAFWHGWVDELAAHGSAVPSALRCMVVGSERPAPERCVAWRALGGARIAFANGYGPSETTITATMFALPPGARDPDGEIPIGQPLPNVRAYVLDPWLEPTPTGVPGELYLGGTGLARGYLDASAQTAERFVPDPFGPPGGRLYRTGDVALRRGDGELVMCGRLDEQVKLRGFRVEPGEVEAVLARHPGVREAAVAAITQGTADPWLAAWVVADPAITDDELRTHLQRWLPDYMQPALARVDRLPRTVGGKIDRRALPVPERAQRRGGGAPRTPLEQLVANVWAQLLGIEQIGQIGQLGVDDHFFELGGHSLLATRLVSRLRALLGVEVPLRTVFDAPTLGPLARRLEELRASGRAAPPPIVRANHAGELPLSFAQERLWVLTRLQPDNPFYNMAAAVRFVGRLDAGALERAFTTIARRHDALRTTFHAVEGRPVQRVVDAAAVPIPIIELGALAPVEREAEVQRLAVATSRLPFDLEAAPPWRLGLARLSADEHVLFISMHHIIGDGWSVEVLLRELAVFYRAEHTGTAANVPEPAIQYVDFAAWQKQWLHGPVLADQLAYWRGKLAGAPPVLELPTDHPRPAVQAFNGARIAFTLDRTLTGELRAFARREGATLFMTLLAGYQALLARYSGQTDFVIGSPVANRNRPELEGLIGVCFNTLALRADVTGEPSFRELVRRARDTALGAYEHQDLPFEKLVEELRPPRNLSYTPVFQVVLAFETAPVRPLELPDVTMQVQPFDMGVVRCDLMLFVDERDDQLACSLLYDTDLFERDTIARFGAHFETLLRAALADPTRRVARLSLASAGEPREPGDKDTRVDYHSELRLHELVEAQVDRTPDAVAVTYADDGARPQLTYRELDARANQLAHHLVSLGVTPDSLVAVSAERSLELVIALLAVIKAGAAYVPIDPSYPAERIAMMLEDARPPVLLTQAHLAPQLPNTGARVVLLDRDWPTVAGESTERPRIAVADDGLAYVIFTSGSTGRPKGAMNTHRAIRNRLLWMQDALQLRADDVVLQKTPFSFDVSVWEFFWPLLVGARLAVAPPGQHQDAAALARTIAAENVTTIHFVPSMLQLFLAEKDLHGCRCLARIVCSGEALPFPLVERCHERLPAAVHNLYGPTEAAVDVTWWPCERQPARRTIPIGHAIANTRIHVLDRELQPTPTGVPGELYIGGVALARGYWNRPDRTATAFVPDPFSDHPGARLYRTGDRVRRRGDGAIEYLGRFDHQVKIRGLRVELGDIEAALLRHPGVREAVVVVREPKPGDQRLVAYLVVSGTPPTAAELRAHVEPILPAFMVPGAFVVLDALPLGPSGKVERRALPEPDDARPELAHAYVAPRDTAELLVADMWAHHLGVTNIGVHDDFFALGGHSLLAAQILGEIQELFRISVPLRAFFEAPTIAGLIARIQLEPGGAEQLALVQQTSQEIDTMSDDEVRRKLAELDV